jgi:polygalacturonase
MGFTHFAVVFVLLNQLGFAYQVYRNVKDFGAKGDGNADDSDAIIAALTQDRNMDPSTQTPGFIFFPPGTYKVTKVRIGSE